MAAMGIDAAAVCGSGPNGRIVEADVLGIRRAAAVTRELSAIPAGATEVPLTEMRRAIARRTAESFATIPHFYLRSEIDAGPLVELRTKVADEMHRDHGIRPTITDFILAAMARALMKCSFANRVWHDDRLLEFSSVDIGLQVAVENGLLAPVVRGCGSLGLAGVAQHRSRLVAACQAGKLPADALGGGACSLSNLGIGRVDEFAAIIMPGQSSILAVGRAAPRPWAADGQLCVRTTMRLCLSADHRVMDGLAAAQFLDQIAEGLENPSRMI